jgi:hypothetical protein
MPQDNLAHHVGGAEAPDDALYDALVAALRSNARGRAFLDEYARRARAADTAAALAALARIEARLNGGPEAPAAAAQEIAPELDSDDAYVPFEFEPLPDTGATNNVPSSRTPARSAELMAQVMALSPEDRIALFS